MLTTCPYFDNFEFDILMQVVLGATLSRMLPLQLGFECFQYICLTKFSLFRSKWVIQCAALSNMSFNVWLCPRQWHNFWHSKPFGLDITGLRQTLISPKRVAQPQGHNFSTDKQSSHTHRSRKDFFQWEKKWIFPGGGQREFIQGTPAVVEFHLTNLKLRDKHFSSRKKIVLAYMAKTPSFVLIKSF